MPYIIAPFTFLIKQYAIITNPTTPSQKVGLSIRLCKHMISPETEPPGRSATVPFGKVTTGATDTLDEAGHAPMVIKVELLNPINPIPWLFCNPMKARNKPIPAEEDIRTGFGISLAS
ncbi:hypothetical protein HanIR_Chr09g0413301 [Helianthus annuus]|nr:hypothetical protein HanIR_Chr09g0413301 [Helianthus annuus]